MSRLYRMEMHVTVAAVDRGFLEAAVGYVEDSCYCDDVDTLDYIHEGHAVVVITGETYLSGGESEEEFADRVGAAICAAAPEHPAFDIEVRATYLEDLPYERYERQYPCAGRAA